MKDSGQLNRREMLKHSIASGLLPRLFPGIDFGAIAIDGSPVISAGSSVITSHAARDWLRRAARFSDDGKYAGMATREAVVCELCQRMNIIVRPHCSEGARPLASIDSDDMSPRGDALFLFLKAGKTVEPAREAILKAISCPGEREVQLAIGQLEKAAPRLAEPIARTLAERHECDIKSDAPKKPQEKYDGLLADWEQAMKSFELDKGFTAEMMGDVARRLGQESEKPARRKTRIG